MTEFTFRWLHISDLHVGVNNQGWLWPTFKHALIEDLKRLHSSVGPWQLVIFSGDLTQRGAREEFDKLNEILDEMWSLFQMLGFAPQLFAIPGNHDVTRPDQTDPELISLRHWWTEQNVRASFFEAPINRYRAYVDSCFSNYNDWMSEFKKGRIPICLHTSGILCGDTSASLSVDDVKIGIIGLNSTWLQLSASDYKNELHVDTKQLLAVTANDPDQWCQRHELAILVTHHPDNWLHPHSFEHWQSEIDVPGRFKLHLYGHMHVAATESVRKNGSPARTKLQSSSLLGLESVGDRVKERVQGYSLNQIKRTKTTNEMKSWPRRLRLVGAGHRKIVPDQDFDLEEDNSYIVWSCTNSKPSGVSSVNSEEGLPSLTITPSREASSADALLAIKHTLPEAAAHSHVRKIEQERCVSAIKESRVVWIISDWGMGADGFLASVNEATLSSGATYRLKMDEYDTRDQFFEYVRHLTGSSLEQLCGRLANVGSACLILDDVPVGREFGVEKHSLVKEVEGIARIALDYCPNLCIFICSRVSPRHAELSVVPLRSLDEADLRAYISGHKLGSPHYTTSHSVSALYKITDGIPLRVDKALKQLEVVSLSDLLSMNSDYTQEVLVDAASPALVRTIASLGNRPERQGQRTFELLKALTIFPRGEQLSRIRRFLGVHPFFPDHAQELLDQALIDSEVTPGLELEGVDSSIRTLSVPKTIRDLVRGRLDSTELKSLNYKAAELYFGSEWRTGRVTSSPAYKFDKEHLSKSTIVNANAILIRLFNEAQSPGAALDLNSMLNLSLDHIDNLIKGDHFKSAVELCESLLSLADGVVPPIKLSCLKIVLARGLRMVGGSERARNLLVDVDDAGLSKYQRKGRYLTLSLCYKELGSKEEARDAARAVLDIGKSGATSLQAKGILIELTPRGSQRDQELIDLEARCRKEKAHTVANNLALARVDELGDDLEGKDELLLYVAKTSKDAKDYYNAARAIIKYCELKVEIGDLLDEKQQSALVSVYHFLLNEGLPDLFDRCHSILWKNFANRGEKRNLLNLFRQSSLVWRLHGRDDTERECLKALGDHVGDTLPRDIRQADREAAYYIVRVGALTALPRKRSRSKPAP